MRCPRSRRLWLLLLVLVVAVPGCSGPEGVEVPVGQSPRASPTGLLTPGQPVLVLQVDASGRPDAATVDIAAIENPAAQEFVLLVALRRPGGRPVEAGGFGPYPPDRPGTFSVAIPPGARGQLRDGPVEIVVRLEPADPATELDPALRVVVGSARLETR